MSSLNVTKDNNTITLSGDLTNDFNKMLSECAGQSHPLFGDIIKLKKKLGNPLTNEQIMELYSDGTSESFYKKIWGYICINPKDNSNYIFAIMDSENRDNQYIRIRAGVYQFKTEAKFDVYVIPNA